VSHTLPAAVDAATLRQWATEADAIAERAGTGLAAQLAKSIAIAADAAERDEAERAAYDDEFDRLFPPLDDEEIPEVLPVQPRVDHEFGCEKPCCKWRAG
jgi:hypothetical protein